MDSEEKYLTCPLCGQSHLVPNLRPGQRALCVQCDTVLVERGRLGADAALAFAVTGLCFAVPALLLPFVTLAKFGQKRTVLLTGGFEGLWSHGFKSLGAWVLFCGTLAPFALLLVLAAVLSTDRREHLKKWNGVFRQWAVFIEFWAMPEVQVLGVMVAFFKLGSVVDVSVGPGMWCYAVASFFTLLAWRRFHLQPRQERIPSPSARTVS